MNPEAWLSAYGSAWERKDPAEFVGLFSLDVRYYWTPFDAPRVGRDQLAETFEAAVARQEDIRFEFEILGATGQDVVAHWRCSYQRVGADYRVRLDGVMQMAFDAQGMCAVFREWWHSDEGGT